MASSRADSHKSMASRASSRKSTASKRASSRRRKTDSPETDEMTRVRHIKMGSQRNKGSRSSSRKRNSSRASSRGKSIRTTARRGRRRNPKRLGLRRAASKRAASKRAASKRAASKRAASKRVASKRVASKRARSASRKPRSESRQASQRTRTKKLDVEPKLKEHRFQTKIKQIKDKVSPKYKIQEKTSSLINSILNDIVKNVTMKAKSNTQAYRKKTLTFIDIMVATMNQFGEDNKWIEDIMDRGFEKKDLYESKIKFTIRKGEKEPPISDDDD